MPRVGAQRQPNECQPCGTRRGIIDPPPLELDAVATSGEVRELRERLRQWLLAQRGVSVELVDDLTLATYEALANAVEHAYPVDRTDATVNLAAHLVGDTVAVTVTDHGHWRPPDGHGAYGGSGGHGTILMRRLVERVDISPGPDGTTVELRAAVPGREGLRGSPRR